jgi:hypothetical protein
MKRKEKDCLTYMGRFPLCSAHSRAGHLHFHPRAQPTRSLASAPVAYTRARLICDLHVAQPHAVCHCTNDARAHMVGHLSYAHESTRSLTRWPPPQFHRLPRSASSMEAIPRCLCGAGAGHRQKRPPPKPLP